LPSLETISIGGPFWHLYLFLVSFSHNIFSWVVFQCNYFVSAIWAIQFEWQLACWLSHDVKYGYWFEWFEWFAWYKVRYLFVALSSTL
jgi:hypothetical protein